MSTSSTSHPGLEGAPSRTPLRWHYFAIFLIPAVLWLINPKWLFQNTGNSDPSYYFGEFRHFPRFQNIFPNYAGERMTWIALLLLGLALAMNTPSAPHRRDICLFLSGMAWFAMVYTYIAWLTFTPAYFYVVVRTAAPSSGLRRTIVRSGLAILCGALAATSAVSGAYRFLGGKGVFFYQNVTAAAGLAHLRDNLWVDSNWFLARVGSTWYLRPAWLVFPILAVCLASICAAASAFRRVRLSRPVATAIWFYLYCFAAMVVMTFRENRLLAFDYRTSILMPGVFLTLGIALFRVPETTRPSLFYAVTALGAVLCVMPLARVNLYRIACRKELIVPVVLLILAVGCWMRLRRPNPMSWAVVVVLSGVVSFGLRPSNGAAWGEEYRGRDVSERVTRAMQTILKRVPEGRYPMFWFNNFDDPLTGEYHGIMCAFLAHNRSMYHFLRVDKHYESGVPIIVLTEQRDVTAAASYRLAQAGMPVVLVAQDPIDYGGVSYWITHLEVLPWTMANLRRGFAAVRLDRRDMQPFGQSELSAQRGNTALALKRMTLPDSGVYQFEIRYRLTGGTLRFGAVSPDGKWIEQNGPPMEEGGGQVSWFRIGVKAGEPVGLAFQVNPPAGSRQSFTTPPMLSVFRDGSAISPEMFEALLERPDPASSVKERRAE